MKKHVFLAVLLCAFLTPSLSQAGELQQQWQQKKDAWRSQWQQQQGGGQAAAAIGELKEKLSSQDAQALKENLQQAKDKYLSTEQRSQRWESFKAEHPNLIADLKGTDQERRVQWEEWQNQHKDISDKWTARSEEAHKKWEDFKKSQEGDSEYAQRQNWKDFKFQNRDEALEAKRKYDEWAKQHEGMADSLKARATAWKAAH